MKSKLLNILPKLLLRMHFLQVSARLRFFQKAFADHHPLEFRIGGTALGPRSPMPLSAKDCQVVYDTVISLAPNPIDC